MGIKKNFLYNTLLTASTYIIGFVTFPYVARVLGAEKIGSINFVDNIIGYFLLFSTMGVASLGMREVAANCNERKKLDEIFSSLIFINTCLTFLAVLGLLVCVWLVPKFSAYRELFLIGLIRLVSTVFLVDWLYQGLQNFKYITTRSLIVKIIFIISLLLFVHTKNDYAIYYILMVVMVFANAVINIFYSRKFVSFSIHLIEIRKYIKPYLLLGVYLICISMYSTFNVVYLGFVKNDEEVGVYVVATKLYTIGMAIFSAFMGVMLPRMCQLTSVGDTESCRRSVKRSFEFLFSVVTPFSVYCVFFAPQLIHFFAGDGYEKAVLPMRIVMLMPLLVGMSQILVFNILLPNGKDVIVVRAAFTAACVGIAVNLSMVQQMGAAGSACALVAAELTGLLFYFYFAHRFSVFTFPIEQILSSVAFGGTYVIICLGVFFLNMETFPTLFVAIFLCAFLFLVINVKLFKNEQIETIVKKVFRIEK